MYPLSSMENGPKRYVSSSILALRMTRKAHEMADRIELKKGDLPWQPDGAENVVVLHRYDMPLAGIIEQHGSPYFFWCIKGEVTRGTLWGYVAIGDDERHEIEGEPRDQVLRRIFSNRRSFIVAFSIEGRGIVKWTEVAPSSQEALGNTSASVLDLSAEELDLLNTV